MNNINILYVEDDESLAFITKDQLVIAGYNVVHCFNGKLAIEQYKKQNFDLVILDIMLPEIDGYNIASIIRQTNKAVPILFLTAKSTLEDKIKGLKIGADDYITKPYSIDELLLKVEIFLKRCNIQNLNIHDKIISISNTYLNKDTLTLKINNNENKKITYREAQLFEFLVNNLGNVCRREDIQETVWENDKFFSSRSLDVFISRLRKLLSNDSKIKIENVHGIGYRMVLLD